MNSWVKPKIYEVSLEVLFSKEYP